jgi:hypothetical protein
MIFTNYDNISLDYVPDNTSPKDFIVDEVSDGLPRRCFNIKDEFVGFSWDHGEKFEFNIEYNDLTDSEQIIVTIYDYQHNLLKSFNETQEGVVNIVVDDTFNETMKSGIYTLVVKVITENSVRVLDKYYLVIN